MKEVYFKTRNCIKKSRVITALLFYFEKW